MVLEEAFHGVGMGGEVGDGGVLEGEDGGLGRGQELFGVDLEDSGHGGEAVVAQSARGVEGETVVDGGGCCWV